jgi:hypothetical protein
VKLYECICICICICIYDDYAGKKITKDTKCHRFESSIQFSANPQKRETTAGEKLNQYPEGSTLAGEGGDLLRKTVINSVGNFRSIPHQMGDNPAGD